MLQLHEVLLQGKWTGHSSRTTMARKPRKSSEFWVWLCPKAQPRGEREKAQFTYNCYTLYLGLYLYSQNLNNKK